MALLSSDALRLAKGGAAGRRAGCLEIGKFREGDYRRLIFARIEILLWLDQFTVEVDPLARVRTSISPISFDFTPPFETRQSQEILIASAVFERQLIDRFPSSHALLSTAPT